METNPPEEIFVGTLSLPLDVSAQCSGSSGPSLTDRLLTFAQAQIPSAKEDEANTAAPHNPKRKLDAAGFDVKKRAYQHKLTFPLQDGSFVTVRVQTDKYHPFSKRCVRIFGTKRAPKLPGSLTHGAAMFYAAKRDYKEEFELLPRCGQKIGSQLDIPDWKLQRRLASTYARLLDAYRCPRFLELWMSEVGRELHVAISAELDWRHGSVETFHSSLGCFGRYFGTAFTGEDSGDIMDPFAKRTRLTPFEAFFLVDAGTLQVTLSRCPLAVEDMRAILEANVPRFCDRYHVFSELLRTTRFNVKPYAQEDCVRYEKLIAVIPPRTAVHAAFNRRPLPFSSISDRQMMPDFYESSYRRTKADAAASSGFFFAGKTDVALARQLLTLPPVSEDKLDMKLEGNGEVYGGLDHVAPVELKKPAAPFRGQKTLRKSSRARPPSGIDVAFYCCMKAKEWTPPVFDVAISNYRDHSVPVSALFDLMESRKNPTLPVLMERVDCGQVSGYSMTLAPIPKVIYSGRAA